MEKSQRAFSIFLSHLLLFSLLSLNTISHCTGTKTEAEALVRWKHTLSIINGSLDSWNLDNVRNLCQWKGIVCNNVGSISELTLSNEDLGGTLDRFDFASLPNLIKLDLSANKLDGVIPSSIGSLSKLTFLDLSYNFGLSGIIPRETGNLAKLEYVDFHHNNFSGQVPCEISNLQKVLYLDFGSNSFKSPSWYQFRGFPKLTHLDFSYNKLASGFPDFILTCKNLTFLDLSYNSFIGKIPESLFINLNKLEYLNLTFNRLQGSLPLILPKLTKLRGISLDNNNFSDSVPDIFNLMPNLEILELSLFEGKIPPSLGNLGNLQNLYLEVNSSLSSTIPSELGLCTNLTYLNLFGNSLIGFLHLSFTNLTKLSRLMIANTYLSSPISPSFITNWTQLIYMSIPNNSFTGEIPPEIGFFTNLQQLDLRGNRFSGSIPPSIGSLPNLRWLSLSDNLFSGHIPPTIGNLTRLKFLFISANNLTGTVPPEVGDLKSLIYLDLSSNQLSGQLPKIISKLSERLSLLKLGKNLFDSTIPEIFTRGCQLSYLYLNGNQLNGALPHTLVNCSKLVELDIGNNNISGQFPLWLETLSKLRVVVLKSNKFQGMMPISKAKLAFRDLQILDISQNEITGVLPAEYFEYFATIRDGIENGASSSYSDIDSTLFFKGFEYPLRRMRSTYTSIDLSNNKFHGVIPSSIGKIKYLNSLNLSYNTFSGHIPSSIENLASLESLDLRSNQLDGEIPWQLEKLSSLAVLNLSNNHLAGRIPIQGHLLTFDNSSYVGNAELCGLPLTRKCENDEVQPKTQDDDDDDYDDFGIFEEFTWKVVLMGYGCGTLFGLVIGHFIFKYEKPRWFVEFLCRVYNLNIS